MSDSIWTLTLAHFQGWDVTHIRAKALVMSAKTIVTLKRLFLWPTSRCERGSAAGNLRMSAGAENKKKLKK